MSIEVLGMVATSETSETKGGDYGAIDAPFLTRFARAHDRSGFDRVLIGYSATSPDGFAVASHVLNHTEQLKVLIAHRPGFVQPTLVARKLTTLDHLTGGGRVAIHHITGGSDEDQHRDGDFEDKDTRYERTAEFMQVLRQTLTSEIPFDHTGRFYRVEGAYNSVRPATPAGIPLFFGGQSDAAVRVGGEHADVYMLFGEPLQETAERIAILRAEAAKHGRTLQFSLSTRPVVAATENEAWARAEEIKRLTAERLAGGNSFWGKQKFTTKVATSSQRLQDTAARSEVHDERLWFGTTALTGIGGNSSGHVGTAEQVADALLEYHKIGVDKFLIRGFDPFEDAVLWGEELIPRLHAGATNAVDRVPVHA